MKANTKDSIFVQCKAVWRNTVFWRMGIRSYIPGAVAMTEEGDRLVNYSALIPILTGAIQELTARVAALESQLKAAGK